MTLMIICFRLKKGGHNCRPVLTKSGLNREVTEWKLVFFVI